MKGLKACLWIVGVVCLSGLVGLFLPWQALRGLAGAIGVEQMPGAPAFRYSFRVLSATYICIGGFYIILALRPVRYGLMVPLAGAGALFIGIVCAVSGLRLTVPLWYLGDAIFCGVFGILILVFWPRARAEQAAQE